MTATCTIIVSNFLQSINQSLFPVDALCGLEQPKKRETYENETQSKDRDRYMHVNNWAATPKICLRGIR